MIELLLPAGNINCLRAAVNNGADAVYVGLSRFNARQSARNFTKRNLPSIINYCHKHKVKVYITLNTLIKNHELKDFLNQINIAYQSKADAIIIQDPALIPTIKKNFPNIEIHLSTQSTITNESSIPKNVDRVILARELTLNQITKISKHHETEIFIHGALCFCYSGQCLFSSLVGGRSGNRGRCAQPCRKRYNNKYLLSTMDLCTLEKLPQLIETGTKALKVEGRLRSPKYVGTVAKIYRKYIDLHKIGKFEINQEDITTLKQVFNREFTTGFGFNESITDTRFPANRGLYLGQIKNKKLIPKHPLNIGDEVTIWAKDQLITKKITKPFRDFLTIDIEDHTPVYKTKDSTLNVDMGDPIKIIPHNYKPFTPELPTIKEKPNTDEPKLFVKVYNKKEAQEVDKVADIIYYDILKDDINQLNLKHAKLFAFTPRIVTEKEIAEITKKINELKPQGVLVSNRGFLKHLKNYEIHLDYNINIFNDIDISHYNALPIISPELTLFELKEMKNKNFITLTHGNIVLMTTKEPLKAPELIDDADRHFPVRKHHTYTQILNCNQLGLFNKTKDLLKAGIKYFYLDLSKDAKKFALIYKKIINNKPFDDKKIKKGYTTGHLTRGVE